MARIRIEDLPPDTDLTPEELERIFGAGRPSFRPTVEGLENREMYAVNIGTALTPGLPPPGNLAQGPALIKTLTPANQVQIQYGPNLMKQGLGQQMTGPVNPMLAPNKEAAQAQAKFVINRWFGMYLVSAGTWVDPRTGKSVQIMRIQRLDPGSDHLTTVSEGIGYGMLAAVKSDRADAKQIFDALWAYARQHFNKNGLMAWKIGANGQAIDTNAASDADEDMAMALIFAYKRWGNGSYYKEDAKALIGNILQHEVDPNTHSFMAGDWWATATPRQVNPSYLAPAYYKVFQEFTGVKAWGDVANQSYKLLDLALKAGHNTGLVPDWMTPDGKEIPGKSFIYGYDAIRTPWRFALDAVWYGDQRAINYLKLVNKFVRSQGFTKEGILNVGQTYNLDGKPMNPSPNAGSVSMAAIAAIVDPDLTYQHQVWEAVKKVHLDVYGPDKDYGYYNGALRIQSTLLIGGLMEKPVF